MKNKMSVGKKVGIALLSTLTLVSVAATIAGSILYGLINNYLYGSGIEISGEASEQALEYSDSLCKEIAEEGIVLLQNKDDFLPINKSMISTVNVFGWRGTNVGWIGGASGSVNGNNATAKAKVRTLLDAIELNNCEYNTQLIDMYESYCSVGDGKALNDGVSFFTLKEPTIDYYTEEIMNYARDFSDTAIVVLGRQGGEGVDLPNYQLKYHATTDNERGYLDTSIEEDDLLNLVTTNFENVIVIVDAVNMMNFNFLHRYENIDACLWASGTGQSGAYSLIRLLRGKVTPSAKLVDTLPNEFRTDPSFQNVTSVTKVTSNIHYAEDIYVGYRWYETADVEGYWDDYSITYPYVREDGGTTNNRLDGYNAAVQFPFGFGLSYTEFEWELENFTRTDTVLNKDTTFTYEIKVTNVGDRKGKDVVQLYVAPPYIRGGIEKSSIVLAAFAKTELLLPGDSQTLTLSFKLSDIASYDCYDKNDNHFRGYELDEGNYVVSFRKDVHTLKDNMSNNSLTYVLSNNVQYPNDPETNLPVENKFTRYVDENNIEHKPYGDCAVDGSDASQTPITYLSRADFRNTFPQTITTARSGTKVTAGSSYVNTPTGNFVMPTTNSGGSLRLYTQENGNNPTRNQLQSCEGIVINKELMLELGSDYNSPKWEELLDQMTTSEMDDLIQLGGYKTCLVESIGKKYMFDNDGGSGLNRHIQEADQGFNPDRSSWTLFPSTNMLSASWDVKLYYNYGLAIAAEGVASGIDGWYSPACNMHRSLYDGRIAEYPSEDPFLAGIVTAQQVRGATNNGMYTYVKHFAVNENENGRAGIKTWLTEQSLRELYLRPFEIAVKVGHTAGIMAAMNCVGSTLAKYHGAMIDGVLRGEWDFKGTVITDWEGSGNVAKGLYAGLDLWLTGAQVKVQTNGWSNTAVFVTAARNACKHILWAKAFAYYTNQTHDSSEDIIAADTDIIVAHDVAFGWWYVGVWSLTVATAIGTTVFVIHAIKSTKKNKKVSNNK